MRVLTVVAVAFGLMFAVAKTAPVIASVQAAKEAKVQQAAHVAALDAKTVEACAKGATTYVVYKGVFCK